jgi:hypothetical protein
MNYSSTLLLLSLFRTCGAFAPAAQGTIASIHTVSQRSYTGPTSTSTTTSLDLIPGQGNQLVAAFNAGTTITTTSVQRKQEITTTPFLRRLLMQIIITLRFQQRPRYGWPDGFPFSSPSTYTKKNGKELYYPLVGFQFISSPEGKTCTLPTTSHASCCIHSSSAEREEELYGWFTTSFCPLNWTAPDICREPIITN